MDWGEIFERQRAARKSIKLDYKARRSYLKSLYKEIRQNEAEIIDALKKDLGKTTFEILGSEIGLVLQEIRAVRRQLRFWMRPTKPPMPLSHQPASAKITPQPYGLVLIISPWNYPLQLACIPLVAAIAAGNSVHLKLSEKSPNINQVIKSIVRNALPADLVSVSEVEAREVEEKIMKPGKFNKIFFTGGATGGKAVASFGAKHLIPVALELGGKSPAIVDGTTNMKTVAKRIIWAKMLNAGQSCIAPDFVLVQKDHEQPLLEEMRNEVDRVFGLYDDPTEAMARIVDKQKYASLTEMVADGEVYYSGTHLRDNQWFYPTILRNVNWEMKVMKEEIFGPVLPVLTYNNDDDLFEHLARNPNPLALYLFSKSKTLEKRIHDNVPFGAGGLNHALMQIATPYLPHEGIGASGNGKSHGVFGFFEFSHLKSWHKTPIWPDIKLRYAPYGKKKLNLLKRILR